MKYVVDATDPNSDNYCDELASSVGATELDGSDANSMKRSFAKIASDITRPAYTNVSIKDTLSEYVDFATEDKLNFQVYKVSADKTETPLTENTDYTKMIDRANKTVEVSLIPSGSSKLEDGVTYRVSFNIVPTQKAYDDYLRTGYNDTGDIGTDAPDNTPKTSENQAGFHSNDKATVTYTVEGQTNSDESEYKHPVVQVDVSEDNKTSQTVKKVWIGDTAETVNVVLKAAVDMDNDGTFEKELTHSDYSSLPENMMVQLTEVNKEEGKDKEWVYTWTELPTKYRYQNAHGEMEQKEIHYTVDEVNVPEGYRKEVATADDGTVTITNTQAVELGVTKSWDYSGKTGVKGGNIKVALFKNNQLVEGSVEELAEENGWFCKYEVPTDETERGNYTIKEVVEVTGADGKKTYSPVGESDYIKVGSQIYRPTYGTGTDDTAGEGQNALSLVTIKNTLKLGSIEITKKSESDGETLLAGAVFKVEKDGNEVATITTANDGKAKVENLLPGEYKITEIKSPAGHSLLANPITVTVGTTEGTSDNGYTVVGESDKYYYDLKLEIVNNKVFDMPQGGAHGTRGIVLAGIFMMMAAGAYTVFLRIQRKRKAVRK